MKTILEQELTATSETSRTASPRVPSPAPVALAADARSRAIRLAVVAGVLAAGFAKPLFDLAPFALKDSLYSHILLIPFISAYLVWLKRDELPVVSKPAKGAALMLAVTGVATVAGYGWAKWAGWKPAMADYLAVMMLALVLLLWGGGLMTLGGATMRALAFPAAFLLFMAPFPGAVRTGIETAFQHGSADAAFAMLKLAGMPVFMDGLNFQLPGFSMRVAPECSGIHSSLVLFITSLLAGHLLLRGAGSRSVLALVIIPLGMLRNGFRIFVLGELCVQLDPSWINSGLHHRGGPLFFAASLAPLFLLLLWLRKRELRTIKPESTEPEK